MEEMPRTKSVGRAQSFHALWEGTILPKSLQAYPPKSSLNSMLGVLWRLHDTAVIDYIIGH